MQTLSQYLNGIETKFGIFLFEAIINLHGEDHLKDSFFVFRKWDVFTQPTFCL